MTPSPLFTMFFDFVIDFFLTLYLSVSVTTLLTLMTGLKQGDTKDLDFRGRSSTAIYRQLKDSQGVCKCIYLLCY